MISCATSNLSRRLIGRSRVFNSGLSSRPRIGGWLCWLTALTFVYILASETLGEFPDWSRLGFMAAALLMVSLAIGHLRGTWKLSAGGWFWIAATFLFYCCLRALPEFILSADLQVLFKLVSAFVGGIGLAWALQAGVRYKAFVYALIASNLCSVVAGLYGVGAESTPGDTEVRYAGLTGNSNEFALQLTLGACLIWLFPKKSGALACLLAVGEMAYAVCMTGSRKSLMVLAVFPVLIFVQMGANRKARTLFIGGVIAASLCLLGIILGPTILEQSREITTVQRAVEFQGNNSFETRVNMTYQAMRLWQQAPVVGNGLGAFERLSYYGTYAHNNYAELLCGTGLLGTLLFYAMHLYILYKASRLSGPLRLYCWLFVVLLLALDVGYVSYNRKQTVMILMVLASACATWQRHRKIREGLLADSHVGQSATAPESVGAGLVGAGLPDSRPAGLDHTPYCLRPTTAFRKRPVLS